MLYNFFDLINFMAEFAFEYWKRVDELLNGMTLKELSDKINLSYATMKDMRSRCRYPKPDTSTKIAQYLNTTVDYLMTGNPPVMQKTVDAPELKKIIVTLQENPKLMPFVEKYIESIKDLVSDTEEKNNVK